MDRASCSITLNQPSDVLSGGCITYKKNCCEGKVTEEFCLKCNKKIRVLPQEFMPVKMA